MKKKIYLADDEKNIRDLMTMFLKNEGYDVMGFENGDSLYEYFGNEPSDMIILDIMMSGTDGLSLCSMIREKHNVPIIIVSARDSELDRITGITMGSDDYLAKPFSPMELVARVKSIFRRIELEHNINTLADNNILVYGDLEMDTHNKRVSKNGEFIDFTPTELSFMAYMIHNKEKAVSRDELLKNVWQYDFDVDSRATDDLVKRLRKKLTENNSNVLIKSVWGHGFRLELEEKKEDLVAPEDKKRKCSRKEKTS